jgi:hypothetical protein
MIHRCTDAAGVTGAAPTRARGAAAGHPARGAVCCAPTFAPGAACAAPEHPVPPHRPAAPTAQSARDARLLAHREAWIPEAGRPQDAETGPFVVELPRQDHAVGQAQSLITTMCWPLEDMLDVHDVALTVGEVLREAALGGRSGAAAHGAPDAASTLTLAVLVSERELRIEVGDIDPRPVAATHTVTSGVAAGGPAGRDRTLSLVDALSDEHGVRGFTGGKITWMCWKLP